MLRRSRPLRGPPAAAPVLTLFPMGISERFASLSSFLPGGKKAPSFVGQVVFITGGSRGLGLELARCFAEEGARVALFSRDADEMQRAVEILAAELHAEVLPLNGDVTDRASVEAAIERVVDAWGCIDVLVNNAGVIQVGPFEHMKLEDYETAMDVSFWGPLYAVLAVVPHMKERGRGRIVNVSSIGGKVAIPHLLPYSAGKHALVGLSDGLRAELAPDGIVVTTVCPGLMRTGGAEHAVVKGRYEQEYAMFSVMDSLPMTTISSRRAAKRIVDATRRGAARLVLTPQARALLLADAMFPGLVASAMKRTSRLLPPPTGHEADRGREGREIRLSPSVSRLLGPLRLAVLRNNE